MSDRRELARTLWDQHEARLEPRLAREPKPAHRTRSRQQRQAREREKDRDGEAGRCRRAGGPARRGDGDSPRDTARPRSGASLRAIRPASHHGRDECRAGCGEQTPGRSSGDPARTGRMAGSTAFAKRPLGSGERACRRPGACDGDRLSVLARASGGSPGALDCQNSMGRPAHRTQPERY